MYQQARLDHIAFSHDHMGYLAGVPKTQSFSTVYPNIVAGLVKVMDTYTESIRQVQLTTPSRPPVPGPGVPQLTIKITADGYPMLPDKLLETCSIKTEQERLVSQYIAQHYSETLCSPCGPGIDAKLQN